MGNAREFINARHPAVVTGWLPGSDHEAGAFSSLHGLLHAGVDGEDTDQAGQGQNTLHRPARRGEQQVTASLPGLRPHPAQHAQGAAVDELQGGQIDDNPRVASRGRREHGHDARGIYDVKFPVQRDDDVTAVLAGAQASSGHDGAFLLRQHGRVRARRLSHQLPVWMLRPVPAEVPSCRYPASRRPARPAGAKRSSARRGQPGACYRGPPRRACRLIADQAPGPPAPPTAP